MKGLFFVRKFTVRPPFPRTNLMRDALLSRKKLLRTRRSIKRTVLRSEGTQQKAELAT